MSAGVSTSAVFAQEAKSVFTHKFGAVELSVLSEGEQRRNADILIGATPEMLQKTIPEGTFLMATNAFLVRSAGKNILIDGGYGRKLLDNLQSLGVSAEQIDAILITHLHGDHIGGLVRDGKASFPNATLYLSQAEHDGWLSDEVISATPENQRGRFKAAQAAVNAYKNRLRLFTPDEVGAKAHALLPNIQGIAAYGHTTGHTMYMLGEAGQQVLVVGDLLHVMPVQSRYPQFAVSFDANANDAVAVRKKIWEYVSQNNIPIAGSHVAYPSIGYLKVATEGGYTFTPLR